MYGTMVLMGMSDCAAKAAAVYPRIIRILNDAGVPPDERVSVMACVMQVIGMDALEEPRVLN